MPAAVLPSARDLDDPSTAPDERTAAADTLRNPRRIDSALLRRVLDGLRRL
ncbi:hypothetical protein [Saccharothrix violaceirubra]|uniref:Uncharacterized protein n=1 Tax=Saccharothrix violaceirubra TaxID=413306 RepID=A0A7W7T2J1_9PSEU|nr:hypothetical protein [Saccharothrix violaceirubra]MBB4965379.1 hypothetical protein [Saccharothrix violaceirubra]